MRSLGPFLAIVVLLAAGLAMLQVTSTAGSSIYDGARIGEPRSGWTIDDLEEHGLGFDLPRPRRLPSGFRVESVRVEAYRARITIVHKSGPSPAPVIVASVAPNPAPPIAVPRRYLGFEYATRVIETPLLADEMRPEQRALYPAVSTWWRACGLWFEMIAPVDPPFDRLVPREVAALFRRSC